MKSNFTIANFLMTPVNKTHGFILSINKFKKCILSFEKPVLEEGKHFVMSSLFPQNKL